MIYYFLAEGFCAGRNFGPRNITRTEGTANDVTILCQFYPIQATPVWKINDTIYYFSDVPQPFIVSQSGRDIFIPVVDSSLDGTSFQCFNPGNDIISSSIGVLTVIDNGMYYILLCQSLSLLLMLF